MVVLGILLVVVTLMYPPYYGRGGADESDTSVCKSTNKSNTSDENNTSSEGDTSDKSKDKHWYDRTGANRLRLAIDLGMLWTYICALVAILLHTNTSHEFHDGNTLFSHSADFCLSVTLFMYLSAGFRDALIRYA